MRFWKPAMTLRSNQIMKMTAMSMTTKATTTLRRTMPTSAHADVARQERVDGEDVQHQFGTRALVERWWPP